MSEQTPESAADDAHEIVCFALGKSRSPAALLMAAAELIVTVSNRMGVAETDAYLANSVEFIRGRR